MFRVLLILVLLLSSFSLAAAAEKDSPPFPYPANFEVQESCPASGCSASSRSNRRTPLLNVASRLAPRRCCRR
ncbi:MAG: hypothetical protein ACO1RA_02485 [Planctomycetaceae bacterium]